MSTEIQMLRCLFISISAANITNIANRRDWFKNQTCLKTEQVSFIQHINVISVLNECSRFSWRSRNEEQTAELQSLTGVPGGHSHTRSELCLIGEKRRL